MKRNRRSQAKKAQAKKASNIYLSPAKWSRNANMAMDSEERPNVMPCEYFQNGTCRFGAICRFSHDVSPEEKQKRLREQKFYQFRRRLTGVILRDPYLVGDIWAEALTILSDEAAQEQHQQLLLALSSEDGRSLIASTIGLVSEPFCNYSSAMKTFLEVLSCPTILNSMSMKSFVGQVFASISGSDGERAADFFTEICKDLVMESSHLFIDSLEETLSLIKIIPTTIINMSSYERKILSDDSIINIISSLDELFPIVFSECPKSQIDIYYLQLYTLNSLASSRKQYVEPILTHDEGVHLPLPVERHGNGSVDISRISIMPTVEEILSGEPEHLTRTRVDEVHALKNMLHDYIDTTFRNLRHIVIASVEEPIRSIVVQDITADEPHLADNSKENLYLNARVRHILIEKGRPIETVLSFRKPEVLTSKKALEQRLWWEKTRRLEEGVLVCFVVFGTGRPEVLFFRITSKNISKDGKYSSRLVSGTEPPTVTAKLVSMTLSDVAIMSHAHLAKTRGVLVEFRGLVPDSFMPVLHGLQRSQLEGGLALPHWVTSLMSQKTKMLENWDMDLSLAATKSHGIGHIVLKEDQEQDHHQALSRILTEEYVVVHGPIGTDKASLALKALQILMTTRRSTSSAPALVIFPTKSTVKKFMDTLLHADVEEPFRVSFRSGDYNLEGKVLQIARHEVSMTNVEKDLLDGAGKSLTEWTKQAGISLKPLHQVRQGPTWEVLKQWLVKNYPKIHDQLGELVPGGQTSQGDDDPLIHWLGKKLTTPWSRACALSDTAYIQRLEDRASTGILSIAPEERQLLVEKWIEELGVDQSRILFEAANQVGEHLNAKESIRMEISRRALVKTDAIVLTTKSLMENIELLNGVQPKAIIVDDMADSIGTHAAASLISSLERFVLISDDNGHRPTTGHSIG